MDAEDDWKSSSGEVTDTDQINDEDFYSTSACLSKLQFRSDVSKAKWNVEMGMAEVIEKKGKMWIATGIVRNGKTFCLIEETLFLAEIGALLVMDDNDECLALKDIYKKISEETNGCSWELFEVYKHLKSLGYVVGRHGVPWSMKGVENNSKPCSSQGTIQNNRVEGVEENSITCAVQMLSNLQVDELRLNFDVYLPNSKFRKSSPGDPAFLLCLVRGSPPANAKSEVLERQCGGIPLKLCHVDHGRVSFFSFKRVELPILP
ncbi:PREDICTED: tRNA-splicing endonuclease subunit Sen54-like isoform X1 [Populus euphratica]|uniref:tRNA-splicing endonuclease subunit Sen54-like isoform X1 n=2 Tax=Populus euphratica TaxID=75702 RepID=A0AAJ6XE71_POPEU|nr:PREDICTED: tRNA-splicing endonuclease subunit Sen54-like isoform X1 [Populus euphratica]